MTDSSVNDDSSFNSDLSAVRTLLAPRTTGEPPTFESIVARLGSPLPHPQPRRDGRPGRWRWVQAPIAVTVALLAVVSGVVAVRHYTNPSVGLSSSDPIVRVLLADHAPYPDGAALDPAAALASLIEVAPSATPATVGTTRYLVTRRIGRTVGANPDGSGDRLDGEVWRELESWTPVQLFVDGRLVPDPPSAQDGADQGPSLDAPTPRFLAGLPTDVPSLQTILLSGTSNDPMTAMGEGVIFERALNLIASTDLFLPTALRVALLRVIAGLGGISAVQIDAEGLSLVSIRMTNLWPMREIIFDPTTARAVGRGLGYSSMDPAGDGRNQLFWVQRLVNTLSEHA